MKACKIIFYFFALLFSTTAFGQIPGNQRTFTYELRAGVTIGGTSPFPLPVQVRKIEKYSPNYNAMIEAQVTKWVTDKYGVTTGVRFENKGMETAAFVKSYFTKIVEQGNEVKGYWTGTCVTNSKISYLTIPILFNYAFGDRWRVQTGTYISYNMNGKFFGKVSNGYLREETPVGQKIEFTGKQYASYDFSEHLRKMGFGAQLSTQWLAYSHFYVLGEFTWGLSDIFKKDFDSISFKMYPIYIAAGASYQF
ncbi:MAG: hypothetical protein CSB06_00990 [Bacteroidia bacterium]|nr:MAG: hypothetical protein CSB06_00990 [Bacteroidia bacterium]